MKALINYSDIVYDPGPKTFQFFNVTFTVPLMIFDITANRIVYLFSDPSLGGDWDPFNYIVQSRADLSWVGEADLFYAYVDDGINPGPLLQALGGVTPASSGTQLVRRVLNSTTGSYAAVRVEGEDEARHIEFGDETPTLAQTLPNATTGKETEIHIEGEDEARHFEFGAET